ncbi:MAG: DRTGG domain-containing protein [Bacteroidales bacterium]
MTLRNLIAELDLRVFAEGRDLDRKIAGGYASDLLSDVMGHAQQDTLWITLQNHLNVVAVASLKDLAGIILVHGQNPAPEVLQKAVEEGIALLGTPDPTFETCARISLILSRDEEDSR